MSEGREAYPSLDPDVVQGVRHQRRRRDLQNLRGVATWIETSGADRARRFMQWRGGGARPLVDRDLAVGSALYLYGGPAWCATSEGLAYVRSDRLAISRLNASGEDGETTPLGPGVGAGYLRSIGDGDLVVVVDHGAGRGRSIQLVGRRGARTVLYGTANFIGDLVVSPEGDHLAWVEWSNQSTPMDGARLMLGRRDRGRLSATEPAPGLIAAQPIFWSGELFALGAGTEEEPAEWFSPGVVEGGRVVDLGAPPAEFRPDWTFGRPWWAPVGDALVLGCVHHSVARSFLVDADRVVHPLADTPAVLYELCSSEDGVVAVGSTASQSNSLFHLDRRKGAWRSLEDEPPRQSATVRRRRSARGVPYLWWPSRQHSPGLVVSVHAGPAAYTSPEFSWMREIWCREGLAVAGVDYRGSTSYGRSFRRALWGGWGKYDVEDVLGVVADLVGRGEVDPARVFVRGASAGGLTALLCGCSELVSGVVAVSPVADLAREVRQSPEIERRHAELLVGEDQEAEELAARSPMDRAHEMRARVLLVHGTVDEVVPIETSRRLADRLRSRGVEVRLEEVEGEGHTIRGVENLLGTFMAEAEFYRGVP